jgi:hypothetical protein
LPPLLADPYVKRAAIISQLDAQGLPIAQNAFAAGISQVGIYLQWEDMPAHTSLCIGWYRDGRLVSDTSMVVGGTHTFTNYLSASERSPLRSGSYEAVVMRDDLPVATLPFTVGVPMTDLAPSEGMTGIAPAPAASSLLPLLVDAHVRRAATFEELDDQGRPVLADVFPAGVRRVGLYVEWEACPPGTQLQIDWHREGRRIQGVSYVVEGTRRMTVYLNSGTTGGLRSGSYEVSISRDGTPVTTLTFRIGGT